MSRVPAPLRRSRWWLALVAAFSVALVVAGTTSGFAEQSDGAAAFATTEALTETEVAASQPEMVLAPQEAVVTNEDADFRFEVLVKNPADAPPLNGTVVLTIDTLRAESAEDLQYSSEQSTFELTRFELVNVSGDEDQRFEAVVLRDDFPLLYSRAPGVYAVHAEFLPAHTGGAVTGPFDTTSDPNAADPTTGADTAGGDGASAADTNDTEALPLVASTAIIWNGVDAASPLALTFVVPIVLPSDVRTLPTRDELTRHAPRLLQIFDAAEQRHSTIAIDPRIIAGIRALGTAAPDPATELLTRIERSTAPIFLLQFADADPAVQAALDFSELMQPIGATYATSAGTFQAPPQATLPPSADAAATPDTTSLAVPLVDPVTGVPTLAALLGLENSRPGAWPAGGEVDSETLALLRQAGITSIVLDSTNVANATSPRVTLLDFDALIADAQSGVAARTAIVGATATERSAGTAELTARLALGAQNNASGAVLALDRGAMADASDPLQIFQTIDALTWVHVTSERQQAAGSAALRAGASTEERRELLRTTLLRSAQIDELSPLLTRPEYLLEFQRERVLEALATRYAGPGVDFAAVNRATKQRDTELLLGVHPVVTENTQLVGTLSNVPVTLSNALPFETAVTLRVSPTSAGIALQTKEFKVRVPELGSANTLVPVQSRISSGTSGLSLEVLDRYGERSFATSVLPLTLHTTIETILMWLLGSVAALLLGFGIWRSIRRRRRGQATKVLLATTLDVEQTAENQPPTHSETCAAILPDTPRDRE